MTGIKTPVGVAGASVVLGGRVAKGALPFTGIALGLYLAFGAGLLLLGVVLRFVDRAQRGNR